MSASFFIYADRCSDEVLEALNAYTWYRGEYASTKVYFALRDAGFEPHEQDGLVSLGHYFSADGNVVEKKPDLLRLLAPAASEGSYLDCGWPEDYPEDYELRYTVRNGKLIRQVGCMIYMDAEPGGYVPAN